MNYISYFDWLINQIECDKQLGNELDAIEFQWRFLLDENRAAGGLELRKVYSLEYSVELEDVRTGPCSVLEMFVALSMRFSENADISVPKAFHEMINNLTRGTFDPVRNHIIKWMRGDYLSNGIGSPFPLYAHDIDARNLDIWALMTIYINEHYSLPENWLR